jgi:hypothetical protein
MQLIFQAQDVRTVGVNPSANLGVNQTFAISYSDGVAAQQANAVYQNQLALTAGLMNVDMSGVLTDQYGTLLTPVRVKGLVFQNNSVSNNMVIGAGTNPWIGFLNATGTITLPPGAWFALATPDAIGFTIVAGTGDILKVAGTGTDPFTFFFFAGKT